MIFLEYVEDGTIKYPFASLCDRIWDAAWALRDINEQVMFYENARLFEAFRGGLTHADAMSLSPAERAVYLEIADKIVKIKNAAVKGKGRGRR